jgi:hypothetical protein
MTTLTNQELNAAARQLVTGKFGDVGYGIGVAFLSGNDEERAKLFAIRPDLFEFAHARAVWELCN